MSLVEFKDVWFKYDRVILSNINLNIEKGEFVVVCGHSGSGKTTLLRLIKESVRPSGFLGGNVLFDGKERLSAREDAERIAFIGQDAETQMLGEKVWQHIVFGLESLGSENGFIRQRAAEAATYFGIGDIFNAEISSLSGGQKQLVNLASAIMTNPDVIILDEPVSMIDPIGADRLFDMLTKINRDLGITVIMSEHRMERCLNIAGRIVVLDSGEIVFNGDKAGLNELLKKEPSYRELFPDMVRLGSELGLDIPFNAAENRSLAEGLSLTYGRLTDEAYKKDKVFSFDGLWFRYEKADVLKGAVGGFYEGEVYALLGGNGAGKSTLISVLCGAEKPYRGRIERKKDRIGYIPQNPKVMFFKDSIFEDLKTAADEEKILKMAEKCRIDNIMMNHPFDVSGGELQRAALCKVLLTDADIIFMDEPTKGMDGAFKAVFSEILKEMKADKKTIVMVSHDMEFCAENADRCGLFFGGVIITEAEKRQFFSANRFYTTNVNRAFKGIVDGAVTCEDVLCYMGRKKMEPEKTIIEKTVKDIDLKSTHKKHSAGKIVMLSCISALAVASRLVFFMLPEFKPMTAIIIAASGAFGPVFGLLSGMLTMLVSNMFFGQGLWTLFQMAAMGIVGAVGGSLVSRTKNRFVMAAFGFAAVVVIYGGIVNLSTLFMYQRDINANMIAAVYLSGLPFDIMHGAFTAAVLFVFGPGFIEKLVRIKKKYHIGSF